MQGTGDACAAEPRQQCRPATLSSGDALVPPRISSEPLTTGSSWSSSRKTRSPLLRVICWYRGRASGGSCGNSVGSGGSPATTAAGSGSRMLGAAGMAAAAAACMRPCCCSAAGAAAMAGLLTAAAAACSGERTSAWAASRLAAPAAAARRHQSDMPELLGWLPGACCWASGSGEGRCGSRGGNAGATTASSRCTALRGCAELNCLHLPCPRGWKGAGRRLRAGGGSARAPRVVIEVCCRQCSDECRI